MPEQVRRGECAQCGERTAIQQGWVRSAASARQRWMCRRCWRALRRANQVLTPQVAGKLIARYRRAMERVPGWASVCRHGRPEGAVCHACNSNRSRRASQRARREQERLNQALDVADTVYRTFENTVFTTPPTLDWSAFASGATRFSLEPNTTPEPPPGHDPPVQMPEFEMIEDDPWAAMPPDEEDEVAF